MIAEAARVGDFREEEYEWDSYSKVKEQYRLEEIQAEKQVREARRARQRGERKKKPVSDAHRKAISDAIRAKWADPVWTYIWRPILDFIHIYTSFVPFVFSVHALLGCHRFCSSVQVSPGRGPIAIECVTT